MAIAWHRGVGAPQPPALSWVVHFGFGRCRPTLCRSCHSQLDGGRAMSFITAVLCPAGLAAFAAAVLGGGFYLIAYRTTQKKRQSERAAAAAAARAGGLAALGPRERSAPDPMSPAPRPPTPVRTHSGLTARTQADDSARLRMPPDGRDCARL